ncbi:MULTISPECIES: hypothetical protein [unclassified Exiguobacterium]|uniref:hypothetical protein n=1 Tax=unclassified Exiguobacterium TaxID=2644629 RepID=UPI0025BE5CDF|nr:MULTISPECIES: hypothetical protein [unclassified Exiguobacterium]
MDSIIQTVQNHGERIALLEQSDEKMRIDITSINDKLSAVERSQLEIKSTLHDVSRETRSVIRDSQEMTRGLFKSQETAIAQFATAFENERNRQHDQQKLTVEVKDKRSERVWAAFGKWSLIIVPTLGGIATILGIFYK